MRLESYAPSSVFLTSPCLVATTRYGATCVVADRHHLGDLLVGLERQDVGDVLAARGTRLLGQLVRLGPIDPAAVGEEQQPVMRRRHEEVLDDVVLAQRRALHTAAAALLRAVEVGLGALGVAAASDRDHHVLAGDEVFGAHVALVRDEPRLARVTEAPDDLAELLGDDLALALRAGQQIFEVGDLGAQLGGLVDDPLALEGGEPAQLHVEDGGGLDLRQLVARSSARRGRRRPTRYCG